MANTVINELGEYIPGKCNSLNLNRIKAFIAASYYIPWYSSSQSRKVFPLMLQELSDLNPTSMQVPGLVKRNPFFDHCQIKYFTALTGGKPAGRIAAFIDYHYHQHTGWIGCFESVQDQDTAFMLFDAARSYLKDHRCSTILGPAKFNAGGEIGLLVDGFEHRPCFMEPYNPPYYQDFFDSYGFRKENDWYSISTDALLSKPYMEKIARVAARIANNRRNAQYNGYTLRNIDFSDIKNEISIIRELYNDIWNDGHHPQQVKMTPEEFEHLALGIKEIALPQLIFIAEKEGQPIAVSVNLPDINEAIDRYDRTHRHTAGNRFYNVRDLKRDLSIFLAIKNKLKQKSFTKTRLFILGIKKEYRKNGLDSKLYAAIAKNATAMGITHGSASQLADINLDIVNPIGKLGTIAMTWRVYKADL